MTIAATSLMLGFAAGWLLFPETSTTDVVAERAARAPSGRSGATLRLLAVGVGDYGRSSLTPLEFARADALSVADVLREQLGERLYADVDTTVLTDDAAGYAEVREALDALVRRAAPDDVVVLFFAGHGIVEPGSGRYYFLTKGSRLDDLATSAVAMSDVDSAMRAARRRARAVVLLLDTCHSGALRTDAALRVPIDPGSGIAPGAGLFLLAATKPGEVSREYSRLSHGVFSHALLTGLAGEADRDGSGIVSISELFGHVAREVSQLTGGAQNPYYRFEGTDLAFASVGLPSVPTRAGSRVVGGNRVAVLRFENLSGASENDWYGDALRMAFNTELSKVAALYVFAPELVDETVRRSGLEALDAAGQLEIDRLVVGSFGIVGGRIRIDARIVSVDGGLQEGSGSVEGELDRFFDLQKQLVLRLLRRLRVRLLPTEGRSIEDATNTDVDAYRLLLQSEGVFESDPAPVSGDTETSEEGNLRGDERSDIDSIGILGARIELFASRLSFARSAWASDEVEIGETTASQEVAEMLATYAAALEREDLDAVEALYVDVSAKRREHQRRYLSNAQGLRVEIVDVEVRPRVDGLVVSFTRRDRFTDRRSGRIQSLEVRLTRLLELRDGQWRFAGKP